MGDNYFELKIEKEKVGFDDNGDEVKLDFGDSSGDKGDGKKKGESEADRNVKKAKPSDVMEEDRTNS